MRARVPLRWSVTRCILLFFFNTKLVLHHKESFYSYELAREEESFKLASANLLV